MKCDELTAYGMADPAIGDEYEMYKVTEVDAAIAELKEENESLLQQNRELCQALQVMYSEAEYKKLQRALWLARAERAKEKQQLFHFSSDFEKLCIDGFYDPYSGRKELSPKQWVKVFNKVETKCLEKAEEYK